MTMFLALKYSEPDAMAHFDVMDSNVPIHCCFSLNEGQSKNRSLKDEWLDASVDASVDVLEEALVDALLDVQLELRKTPSLSRNFFNNNNIAHVYVE